MTMTEFFAIGSAIAFVFLVATGFGVGLLIEDDKRRTNLKWRILQACELVLAIYFATVIIDHFRGAKVEEPAASLIDSTDDAG